MHRRDFLTRSSLVTLGGFGGALSPQSRSVLHPLLSDAGDLTVDEIAQDDAFWMNIRKSFIT
ncbi:MAG: twin-arginine translocation signal domain-containing protein, partial [Gemmatimonadales bacterium]